MACWLVTGRVAGEDIGVSVRRIGRESVDVPILVESGN